MGNQLLPNEIMANIYKQMSDGQLQKVRTINSLANQVFVERKEHALNELTRLHELHPYITIINSSHNDMIIAIAGMRLIKSEAENLHGNKNLFRVGMELEIPDLINEAINNTNMVNYFQILDTLKDNPGLSKKLLSSSSTSRFLKYLLTNTPKSSNSFLALAEAVGAGNYLSKWCGYLLYTKNLRQLPSRRSYDKQDVAYVWYQAGFNQDFDYMYRMTDYDVVDFASGLLGYYTATGDIKSFLSEFSMFNREVLFPISGKNVNEYSIYRLTAKLDNCNKIKDIYRGNYYAPYDLYRLCKGIPLPTYGVTYYERYHNISEIMTSVKEPYSYLDYINTYGVMTHNMLAELTAYTTPSLSFVLATYNDNFELFLASYYFNRIVKVPIIMIWLAGMVNGTRVNLGEMERQRQLSLDYNLDVIVTLLSRADNYLAIYREFQHTFQNTDIITRQLIGNYNMVELAQ